MLRNQRTDWVSWAILIAITLFLAELLLFHGGAIFFLMITVGCMYIGRKRMPKMSGTALFWFGLISFVICLFHMVTFRLFLFLFFVYIVIQFAQSKRTPIRIQPIIQEQSSQTEEALFQRTPLLQNTFFGSQKTPEHVYEWNDIDIQVGIGDTIIDLSYTVLPKGEAVVVIRHLIGNIQILVPYEVEVSIHHSVIIGSLSVFQRSETKLFNETLHFQTAGYDKAERKVKILTSMIAGALEVKRI
ncbi:cell wall-active antibiotics response protein LiaF [Thermaerobacillus caldiproteolyticus]|uniref:Lia operon protein LiaF n=1 Tax=Thermaerobacillus caldiproteolyticus TaxID=247480 RepID=A0A7W0BYB1_9BACL|nr:cell wall-active antibiotics response protein LiaF [Anoxybacillus caldiproteolyticus]MBA2874390.1 lia operon protein LiaF [Anoxybacillus caldiproteolyticus]QPA30904.1 cell wall-active antibiotics response protein [Anoxybacillus caldiproteolyticus]